MTKQIDKIMEQAQVFASAWSLVGGRFDGSNAMDNAEVAKNELRQMVAEALTEQPAQPMHPEIKKMYEDYFDKCFREGYVPEPVKPAQQEPLTDIYRSFEQWKSGNVLEHGVPRTEHYSEAQLDLVEMGWNYGYDAGRAVEQALDKKAENARELGLDYEPAQQEPVAWLHTKIEGVAVPHRPADLDKHLDRWEALYRTPPCPTCEALARTVMMDQTGRDA